WVELKRHRHIRRPTNVSQLHPFWLKIAFGRSLFLSCLADGWPQPSISWTLPNGVTLDKPQSIARVTVFTNGTLLLRHAATFDKGTYTCRAANPYGTAFASYPVVVTVHPPRISSALSSVTRVLRGTAVTLPCTASGVPQPEISWTLPGRTTIFPHNRYAVHGGCLQYTLMESQRRS
uniref:Ig-like domain-containing protein n=1 Tax=Neogobius melanostomus TaxID=47308 RepID=A0A8C6S821_9GOBI